MSGSVTGVYCSLNSPVDATEMLHCSAFGSSASRVNRIRSCARLSSTSKARKKQGRVSVVVQSKMSDRMTLTFAACSPARAFCSSARRGDISIILYSVRA